MPGLTFRFAVTIVLSLFLVSGSAASDDLLLIPVPLSNRCDRPGTFVNFLGMKFIYVSSGTFSMGSPGDEPGRAGDETQHQVTLTKGFYLQTTEVTQGQWKALGAVNPSVYTGCGDSCPVENVSWDDAQSYISLLNFYSALNGEGLSYRLPTEAEWEYACRAASVTAFANGPITYLYCSPLDPNLGAMGWYCGNSTNPGPPVTVTSHLVAQRDPNDWRFYDMHGNVAEWVQDRYAAYPTGHVTDPTGPSSGFTRVYRGGSWGNNAKFCRSAYRESTAPENSFGYLGFRLVLNMP